MTMYYRGKDISKGQQGNTGYTPVKGKDYWTPEDVEEIVTKPSEAEANREKAENDRVTAENNRELAEQNRVEAENAREEFFGTVEGQISELKEDITDFKDGFERLNLFYSAELLADGKVLVQSGGRIYLSNDDRFNSYIIPVDGVSVYTANTEMRYALAVAEDKYSVIGNTIDSKKQVDTSQYSGIKYLAFCFNKNNISTSDFIISKGDAASDDIIKPDWFKNIVADKQFELIEEIVCDGQVARYYRNLEPNGKSYDFTSVYLEIEVSANNAYPDIFYRAYDADNRAVLYDGNSVVQKSYTSYLVGGCDCINGFYQGWMSTSNVAESNIGGAASVRFNTRTNAKSTIKTIRIDMDGTNFLSGDKIRIYGVRK